VMCMSNSLYGLCVHVYRADWPAIIRGGCRSSSSVRRSPVSVIVIIIHDVILFIGCAHSRHVRTAETGKRSVSRSNCLLHGLCNSFITFVR